MWSAERGAGGDRRRLLVVLRADSLDAGWLPAGGSAAWRQLAVPLCTADEPALPPFVALRQALLQLQSALAGPERSLAGTGRTLTVLVAAPWLGRVALPWSDSLLNEATAEAQARAELAARGFVLAVDDRWCIDPAPPLGRPRSVLWLPAPLLPALQGLAQALGARRISVQSLDAVAAGWAADRAGPGRRRPARVAIVGGDVLRLLPADGTAAAVGHELALSPGVDPAADMAGLWQRACLRFPALAAESGVPLLWLDHPAPAAPGPNGLTWLRWPGDGQVRAALDRALLHRAVARPTLDAMAALAPAPQRLRQLGALAGVVCLLAAAAIAVSAGRRQSGIDAGRSADAAPLQVRQPAPPTRTELAELRAVNAAVRQINLPWPALLRTLQPPRDIRVTLLGLDLTADAAADGAGAGRAAPSAAADAGPAGLLKLDVEARDGADMTRYLSFLAGRDGVLAAQLLRHEADPARPDAPIRFQIELAWQR